MKRYKYKKSYKPKKRRLIFRSRFFWTILLMLIILGTVLYISIFSSFFQVGRVIISGNEKISKGKIQAVIDNNIEKKNLFFSTKSIFLANLNKIREDILNNFLQIAEVEISRGWPDGLNIIVVERLASANFCQSQPSSEEENLNEQPLLSFENQNLERQDENCFLLDNEGIIFEEGKEEAKVIIKFETSENQMSLGERVIEKEYIGLILKIKKELEENLKINIEEFVILGEKKKLNAKTSESWDIYFYAEENIEDQIFNLSLVLKEKIPPEERGNLEYIDLRFGSRVYFKYKDQLLDVIDEN